MNADAAGWVDLDEAWDRLRPRGALATQDVATQDLLEGYRAARSWQGRVAAVSHATRLARVSELAFQLGLAALDDPSEPVRRRACGLLAYSLRRDAVGRLRSLLTHADPATREDARAAIAAILARDHHLFKDREFSGQIFWIVCEADLDHLCEDPPPEEGE